MHYENIRDCVQRIEWLGENRGELPYDMDGAVIKINSLSQRQALGSTAKAPQMGCGLQVSPRKEGEPGAGYRGAGGQDRRSYA